MQGAFISSLPWPNGASCANTLELRAWRSFGADSVMGVLKMFFMVVRHN